MSKHTLKTALTDVEIEDRKREIAHQIWEDEGRPFGLSEQHWEKACLIVMSLTQEQAAPEPKWLKPKAQLVATIESTDAPKVANATALPLGDIRKHPAHRSAA